LSALLQLLPSNLSRPSLVALSPLRLCYSPCRLSLCLTGNQRGGRFLFFFFRRCGLFPFLKWSVLPPSVRIFPLLFFFNRFAAPASYFRCFFSLAFRGLDACRFLFSSFFHVRVSSLRAEPPMFFYAFHIRERSGHNPPLHSISSSPFTAPCIIFHFLL